MSPGHFRGEELFQSLKHYVAPFAIDLTNQLDVLVEESIACHFVGHELSEGRSVQVGTLLQLRQFADDLRRSDDPSQTEPGSQRLRECAQINDVADGIAVVAAQVLAVEHDQRWEALAFIAQLAVRVIFDNRNAILVRQQHQFAAPPLRQGGSGRVLKVGQHVHELGAETQRLFEQVGAETVFVDRDGNIFRAVHVESLQRAEISRRFHQHAISGIDKQLADQVERLLRAGSDQDVLHLRLDPVARHVVRNQFAQGRVTLRFPVLQGGSCLLGQYLVAGFFKALDGKHIGSGQAAAKGDHSRFLDDLQQLADLRAGDSLGAQGVTRCPGSRHGKPSTKAIAGSARASYLDAYSQTIDTGSTSLHLPDHDELPRLFVGKQKLVDLIRVIRNRVLIFNELRLVVAKCQQHVRYAVGLQFALLSIDHDAQLLKAGAAFRNHARCVDMNVDGVLSWVGI